MRQTFVFRIFEPQGGEVRAPLSTVWIERRP